MMAVDPNNRVKVTDLGYKVIHKGVELADNHPTFIKAWEKLQDLLKAK